MKIQVPRIVKRLDLSEYAPEMGAEIAVWVNPPRAMMLKIDALTTLSQGLVGRARNSVDESELAGIADELNRVGGEMLDWFAEAWSQGADPDTHWTREELEALLAGTRDTDPALWFWLVEQTKAMIREHRAQAKKK